MYRIEIYIRINSIISSLIVHDINISAWGGIQQNLKDLRSRQRYHGNSYQLFTSFNIMSC